MQVLILCMEALQGWWRSCAGKIGCRQGCSDRCIAYAKCTHHPEFKDRTIWEVFQDERPSLVDLLSAVLTDGLAAVEAACAEAVRDGVHSSDFIINILARRREPAAPITILTSDALRLQQEPAADCARYDSLRRAI